MSKKTCSDEEFIEIWNRLNSPSLVAQHLGINVRNVFARRNRINKIYNVELNTLADQRINSNSPTLVMPSDKVRAIANIVGYVIVFSDAHFFPGEKSIGYQALIKLIKQLKPKLIIGNGDLLDGATIHSHGFMGWESPPTLKQELEAVQDAMSGIEKAAKGAILHRTIGNHDIRFDRRLAGQVPEYRDIAGTTLKDHLPLWTVSWSVMVNGNTMIKHRINGGIHSAYMNTLRGGVSTVTGHTHLLEVKPWSDYTGRRWGVSTGMLADPDDAQFRYAEDSPRPWCQGFAVLRYDDNGMLLPPELCEVVGGVAYFRGEPVL